CLPPALPSVPTRRSSDLGAARWADRSHRNAPSRWGCGCSLTSPVHSAQVKRHLADGILHALAGKRSYFVQFRTVASATRAKPPHHAQTVATRALNVSELIFR